MRNENFEAKSNRQTNIAGYSLTNRWAEFHLVEHLFSLPSRPPPSIRENPSRSPWSLSFPGKASFARRFERLISQPTGGQNTRVYKASDPRDAINYSATESATINLSSGREREREERKEREKKRKEGSPGWGSWRCPDERRFAEVIPVHRLVLTWREPM